MKLMRRIFMFAYRSIKFRSISSAKWVDAYEQYQPTHGAK